MVKNITVFGLGKLGCSMAAVFADRGFTVRGYDLDNEKVVKLNAGIAPVYETDLDDLITKNKDRIKAFSDPVASLESSDISFMVVPTPSRSDGTFDTIYAKKAASTIGAAIRDFKHYHVIVLTSTVLPGASRAEIIVEIEKSSGKSCGKDFGFCYSPEFIALGSVVKDLVSPDYFLIGQFDKKSGDALEYVNKCVALKEPQICRMTIEEAELAKISTNSYITMKISFANYMAAICERIPNANVDVVTNAIGNDSRVGKKYLTGGLGYGGPCFPRDNVALFTFACGVGVKAEMPVAVDRFNKDYSKSLAKLVSGFIPRGGKVGIIGLAYKPGSHILEESASVEIANALHENKNIVYYFDKLQNEFIAGDVPQFAIRSDDINHLIESCDAIVFAHSDKKLLNETIPTLDNSNKSMTVIDCWRIIDSEVLKRHKLIQLGLGSR